MVAQLEMWDIPKIPNEVILSKAKERLDKIYRNTQGLFKRVEELKAEAEFLSGQIEIIEYERIYGPS